MASAVRFDPWSCRADRLAAVARSATDPSAQVADTALERLAAGPEDRVLVLGGRDLERFADQAFDRVLGVDVVRSWRHPARDLAEIRRVLRPGGRLVLGFRPAAAGDPGATGGRVPIERVERWLRWAGFTVAETVLRDEPAHPLAWVRAHR